MAGDDLLLCRVAAVQHGGGALRLAYEFFPQRLRVFAKNQIGVGFQHIPAAALDLAAQNKFDARSIAGVTIKLHAVAVKKATDPRKAYPRDKETADHSYHYCIAAALLDGACGPAQFTDERIGSADLKAVIDKTQLAADLALTALYPKASGGGVIVTLADGRELAKTYEYPPGHPVNPLTGDDIARKFAELADGLLAPAAVQSMIDDVMTLDRRANISGLLAPLIAL